MLTRLIPWKHYQKRRADRKRLLRFKNRSQPGLESLETRVLLYSATGNAWPNPQVITLSFVPDGTNLGGVTSNLQSAFNSKPSLAGKWENIILQAAQVWAQQTNINFVVVPDNGAPEGSGPDEQGYSGFGDIRIGGYNFGCSTIARTYEPPNQNNYSIAGDLTFNTGLPFNVGSTYDLFTVAMHEFGHALGLGESTGGVSGSNAVMYPTYTGVKTGLATDDIEGIQSIYSGGSARTPDIDNISGSNGTFATATNLNGMISSSTLSALVPNLDITKAGQVEDFSVTAPSNTGSTLEVSAQSAGLSLLAPKLTVYTSSGSVLATVNGLNQYGTTLTASIPYVYAGEQFYVQVQGADTTQMGTGRYALGLNFKGAAPPAEASPIIAYPNGNPLQSGGGEADGAPGDNSYVGAVPVITGISPDNGQSGSDGITDVNQISILGNAPQGDTVTVYQGGTAIGTAQTNANAAWTFPVPSTLADGVYSFTATQTDPSGNVTPQSSPYIVTINTQIPSPPIISAISPDTGRDATDGYTSDTTPTIFGSATPLSTVTLYDSQPSQGNGQTRLVGTTLADINGNWSYAGGGGSVIQQGLNDLTATATSIAGDVSALTPSAFPLNIITQNQNVPVIAGICPATGSINNTVATNQPALVFQGQGIAGYIITLSLNGQVLGSTTVNPSGTWSYDNTANLLPDGTYSLTATSTDMAGNIGQASPAYSFAIRTALPAAPVIAAMSPVTTQIGNQGYTNNTQKPVFSGTAIANGLVQLYQNGSLIGSVTAGGNGAWTFNSTLQESAGTYDITATVTDSVGNVSAASSPYVMIVKTSQPSPPVISGITPGVITSSGPLTNDPTPTFAGTADPLTTVTLYQSGKNGSIGSATANASGNWSFTLPGGGLGTQNASYSFTAQETDLAGNVSAGSSAFTLTVHTTPPSAPTVTGISPATGTVNNTVATDQPQLFFTGTAVASTTVEVFLNGSLLGTTVSNSAGSWSYNNTANTLTGGTYSLTAKAVDLAGNVSQASQPYNFDIYHATQVAPVITAMSTAHTQVGSVGYTNITKNPTFSGTSAANGKIQLFLNGTSLGTTNANGNGQWSYNVNQTFTPGSYYITATVTDSLGNVSPPSSPYEMVVNTTAPSAPFLAAISPEVIFNGQGLTNNTCPSFSGTSVPGATIAVYEKGQNNPIATGQASASGSWTATVPSNQGLNGGGNGGSQYTFDAVATDLCGNVSAASSTLSLTVDTQAPNQPAITGISPDTSTVQNTVATNQPRLVFVGTGTAGYTVTVSLNGQVLGSTTVNSAGSWSYDNTANVLPEGTYSMTATMTDHAGNVSNASPAYAFTVHTALPPAPVISAMSPVTTQIGNEGYTNNNKAPVFSGTAIANGVVTLYQNGTPIGSVTAGGNGAWTFKSNLSNSDGTYDITATVTDYVGNVSDPASSPYVMVIKTTAPDTPTILGFTPQTGIVAGETNDVTPTFVGTADPRCMVSLYVNGQNQPIGTTMSSANGNWLFSVTNPALNNGSYTITAKTTDLEGNVSSASAPLPLTIITQTPQAPVLTSISPDTGTPGDMITNAQQLSFNGTGPAGTTVTLYLNGTEAGTVPVASNGTWSFNNTANVLPAGVYNVTATATDGAGNVSQLSKSSTVTIQTTPPAAPTVTSISPDTGLSSTDGITSASKLTFNGTALPNSTVNVYLDGTLVGTTTSGGGQGAWSLADSQTLAQGSYAVTATVTDYVGNTSAQSAPFTVTIEETAPNSPVIAGIAPDTGASSTDGITSDKNPTFFGTSAPCTLIAVLNGNQVLCNAMTDLTGNWSATVPGGGLGDGTYNITATATDMAGLTSALSQSFPLTILTHTQNPNITGVSTSGFNNAQNLTITGQSSPNCSIQVFQNGVAIGTTTSNSGGSWTFGNTGTTLAPGSYAFTAVATDLAGNVSQVSNSVNLIIAPVISGVSPTSANVYMVTGRAEALSQVQLFLNKAPVATASADANGNWSLTATLSAPSGTYTLTAVWTDQTGKTSPVSSPFTLQIGSSAPTASVPSLSASSVLEDIQGAITAVSTPTLTGSATANTIVTIVDGDAVLGTAIVNAEGVWTFICPTLSKGLHNVAAEATNASGYTGLLSSVLTFTV